MRSMILIDFLSACACLGDHAGLKVKVSSYSVDVTCTSDAGHDERACSALLGTLPIGISSFVFTKEPLPGTKTVVIPSGGRNIRSGTHATLYALLKLLQNSLLSRVLNSDHSF